MLELPEMYGSLTIRELASEGVLPERYLGNGNPKPIADVWHTFTIPEQSEIVEKIATIEYEANWHEMEAAAY